MDFKYTNSKWQYIVHAEYSWYVMWNRDTSQVLLLWLTLHITPSPFCYRYEVQLHPGQLTLVPFRQRGPADGEVTSSVPVSTVIHLSDGDTSVQAPHGSDTFTLITHKNEYQWVRTIKMNNKRLMNCVHHIICVSFQFHLQPCNSVKFQSLLWCIYFYCSCYDAASFEW